MWCFMTDFFSESKFFRFIHIVIYIYFIPLCCCVLFPYMDTILFTYSQLMSFWTVSILIINNAATDICVPVLCGCIL